jgi:hypothetical protein
MTMTMGITPAMAHIIYTSETKGKPQSSLGKMNYDEFLNALVKIALARQRKSSSRHLQRSTDTQVSRPAAGHLLVLGQEPFAKRSDGHTSSNSTCRTPTTNALSTILQSPICRSRVSRPRKCFSRRAPALHSTTRSSTQVRLLLRSPHDGLSSCSEETPMRQLKHRSH